MAYTLATIEKYDKYANRCMDSLLDAEGICRDKNLDYSCGIFDGERLIATGSCFENTLRCFAVSKDHRGEDLVGRLVSHLVQVQLERGNTHLFVYTKCESARYFQALGFYPIAEVGGRVSFLENRRDGFRRYCGGLKKYDGGGPQAAIVMNANPFTCGHRHLVEKAAGENDAVHLFVLSEDRSLFPFDVRFRLVKEGVSDIPNVILHESGDYIISSATFPGYFFKEKAEVVEAHAALDALVFCKIAQSIGVGARYLGEEDPLTTTGIYNRVLARSLPENGLKCVVVPRLRKNGGIVSAGLVRERIREGRLSEIRPLVPDTTWSFLCSEQAQPVIKHIMEQENVVHD